MTIKNKEEKLRFAIVGSANTVIDFGILFSLTFFGVPSLIANLFSTSAAFCFSFFANKKYTFKSRGGNVKRQILLFMVITLIGLWGVQTAVIQLVDIALAGTALSDGATLFIAKILATLASLIWNYTFYSRIVFKKEEQ